MINWLKGFLDKRQRVDVANPKDQGIIDLFRLGQATSSGVYVSPEQFLSTSGLYAGVRTISFQVATLPLKMYKRNADGSRQIAKDHPLYTLLHDLPNPSMTAWEFKQLMTCWLLVHQNAYARIEKDNRGNVTALYPMHPEHVTRHKKGEAEGYQCVDGDKVMFLLPNQVLSVKGFAVDTKAGKPTWDLQKEAVGLSKVLEQHAGMFFKNGAKAALTLSHPGRLSPEAIQNLRAQVKQEHTGQNSYNTMVLEEGMTATQNSYNNRESQSIESRQHQLNEATRIIGIQPHLIGDLSKATFSNIEQQSLEFLTMTLNPLLTCLEQAIMRDCMTPSARATYFVEFDRNAVVQADLATRMGSYKDGLVNGIYSINEVRAKENLPPVDGGDQHHVQAQMISIKGGVPNDKQGNS